MDKQKLRCLLEEGLKIPEEEVLSNNQPIYEGFVRQHTLPDIVNEGLKRGGTYDQGCATVR